MLLDLSSIQKRFGGVTALRDGNLRVEPGEVHLLMGENGAGKSTLMKIVAGMEHRDGGEMLWQGRHAAFTTPAEAAAAGIAMVHQESLLAPHLTVAENIFLGREERLPFGWVNRGRMISQAARHDRRAPFPPARRLARGTAQPRGKTTSGDLPRDPARLQPADFRRADVVAFRRETEEVFRIVRTLRDRGMGVIYITHRLEELRAIGDRVTVLRDGETVHTGPLGGDHHRPHHPAHGGPRNGRDLSARARPPGAELLRVEGLSRRGALRDVSFSLRAGEIVGMAGLIGAGRTELCRAIFGVDPIDSGNVFVDGRAARIASPREAVAAGIALVPEDRQKTGLALRLPIANNMTMANLRGDQPFRRDRLRAPQSARHGGVHRAAAHPRIRRDGRRRGG